MIRYILSIGLFLICLALPAQRVSVLGDSYLYVSSRYGLYA